MMDSLITYGIRKVDLKLIHILEVENGLACNCVCAGCKEDLVAYCNKKDKEGNILKYDQVSHFKHHSGKECVGAYESTLHLLAKTVLLKTKKIKTPNYHYDYRSFNTKSIFKKGYDITFEKVIIEEAAIFNGQRIKPDAIGEIGKRKVFIEFAKTHFVDGEKKEKLKLSSDACIEIDINELPLDEDIIAAFLNSDTHLKYWITNPKLDKKYSELVEKRRKESEANKAVERQNKELTRQKSKQKLSDYKNHKAYKVLLFKNEVLTNCPLTKQKFEDFKKTWFYNHFVIKKNIDGAKWNQILYPKKDGGCSIYLNNEEIFVYPSDDIKKSLNEPQKKANDLLYAGLQAIIGRLNNPTTYDCKNCTYSVEQINYDGETYQVCKYPLQ